MRAWIWTDWMALLNTCLNMTSAVFIILGVRAIKSGDEATHKRRMLTATCIQAVFLVLYLTRTAIAGDTKFVGPLFWKYVYYLVLFPHLITAAVQTPFILLAIYRALKGNFEGHRKITRILTPVWLYVAVSGALVFIMLRIPY